MSDQVPTLAIHEKSSLQSSSGRLSIKNIVAALGPGQLHEISHQDEGMMNGDVGSPSGRKHMEKRHGGKGSSIDFENKSFGFGPINQDAGVEKVMFHTMVSASEKLVC